MAPRPTPTAEKSAPNAVTPAPLTPADHAAAIVAAATAEGVTDATLTASVHATLRPLTAEDRAAVTVAILPALIGLPNMATVVAAMGTAPTVNVHAVNVITAAARTLGVLIRHAAASGWITPAEAEGIGAEGWIAAGTPADGDDALRATLTARTRSGKSGGGKSTVARSADPIGTVRTHTFRGDTVHTVTLTAEGWSASWGGTFDSLHAAAVDSVATFRGRPQVARTEKGWISVNAFDHFATVVATV